ncbi:MAG: hypothetical protein LC102_02530 [Ignavibacteriales bacterium]|nr:MAG: hypothetical protein F9K26_06045 [Ignavibacteriaceae bacterium]MBW7874238.1 hypothetical protein [Ignavibacteria bacterium]MBZ0195830.1 hypothetical protein [Ignavibacteriaceae bacterium]MCZ2142290.1 hypothetical protein [Ignavibacteriales bacterium]WKZ73452.1 MAG: hypothetical protein QY308_04440 [Ignavibacteriaceae bacterium]
MLTALAFYPYIFTNIYKFPAIKPFSGGEWYNPYADTSGKWFKANFHAHAKAWSGLTNGKFVPNRLDSIYRSMGYDFIGISDYHKISKATDTPEEEFFPIYEHGLNIFKRHQQALDAKKIVNFDYPLFQTLHHKQDMIERMRPYSKLLAINHPEFMDAYPPDDFNYLSNYTHIEILNHFRTSLPQWDAALTAGYPAFGYGNDDSHDQSNKDETGRFWTMVRASSLLNNLILDGLRKGNSIAVKGDSGFVDNELRYLLIDGDSMRLKLQNPADSIRLISMNGSMVYTAVNSDSLSYFLQKVKGYLRAEIYNPKTSFFLNPLIRTNGILPAYKPVKNAAFSFVFRVVGLIIYLVYLVVAYKILTKMFKVIFRKRAKHTI